MYLKKHIISLFIGCLFIPVDMLHAESISTASPIHEITIYLMPSLEPLDWTSPSTLYTSMRSCYLKTIGEPDNYLLGHIAVRISTPLLSKPMLVAMTSARPMEKVDLVLKQKVGYGILGAILEGRLETEKELEHKLRVYAKRKKLAFLTFRVSETGAKRMLQFVDTFSSKTNDHQAPCNFYGGAFCPRNRMEGSGCSAFGMSLVDIAKAIPPVSKEWIIQLNVPTKLIGGEYNNKKKIPNKLLERTHHWHDGSGQINVDFVPYFVYEPSIMFNWVIKNQTTEYGSFTPITENGVPGILFDKNEQVTEFEEPIFHEREEQNIFVDYYFQHKANAKR